MLARRAVLIMATALTVVGSTAGCQADRPPTGRIAVADPAPDPLADIDPVLDAVEQDLDTATADG